MSRARICNRFVWPLQHSWRFVFHFRFFFVVLWISKEPQSAQMSIHELRRLFFCCSLLFVALIFDDLLTCKSSKRSIKTSSRKWCLCDSWWKYFDCFVVADGAERRIKINRKPIFHFVCVRRRVGNCVIAQKSIKSEMWMENAKPKNSILARCDALETERFELMVFLQASVKWTNERTQRKWTKIGKNEMTILCNRLMKWNRYANSEQIGNCFVPVDEFMNLCFAKERKSKLKEN